jgi:hypothetical protein
MAEQADPNKAVKAEIYTGISKVLSKHDMELRRCGLKTDKAPEFDPHKGEWADPNYVTNKPPRWLVQVRKEDGRVVASVPAAMHGRDRLAHYNTTNGKVGGVFIRVVPAMRRSDGEFELHDSWEWTLFFAFGTTLEPGSAAQLLDGFDPKEGTLKYKGKDQPYVAAQIFGLCDPESKWVDSGSNGSITYGEASKAVSELIQVNLPQAEHPETTEGH